MKKIFIIAAMFFVTQISCLNDTERAHFKKVITPSECIHVLQAVIKNGGIPYSAECIDFCLEYEAEAQ